MNEPDDAPTLARKRIPNKLIPIALLAAVGSFLACGYGCDNRGMFWCEMHLRAVRRQLSALKQQLLDYHELHGRYPTNDEGLKELVPRFTTVSVIVKRPAEPDGDLAGVNGPGREPSLMMAQRTLLADNLPPEQHPTAFEELVERRWPLYEPQGAELPQDYAVLDIGCDSEGRLVYLGPDGPLSPWLIPFGYENRRGLDPSAFASSPVQDDSRGRYSMKVDDGIYVYSTGARSMADRQDALWWVVYGPRFAGAAVLLAAAGWTARLFRHSKGASAIGVAILVVGSGLGYGASALATPMCYAMSPLFRKRSPDMVQQHRNLLDKYHQRGIINQTTYNRAVRVLDNPPDGQARE